MATQYLCYADGQDARDFSHMVGGHCICVCTTFNMIKRNKKEKGTKKKPKKATRKC